MSKISYFWENSVSLFFSYQQDDIRDNYGYASGERYKQANSYGMYIFKLSVVENYIKLLSLYLDIEASFSIFRMQNTKNKSLLPSDLLDHLSLLKPAQTIIMVISIRKELNENHLHSVHSKDLKTLEIAIVSALALKILSLHNMTLLNYSAVTKMEIVIRQATRIQIHHLLILLSLFMTKISKLNIILNLKKNNHQILEHLIHSTAKTMVIAFIPMQM